MSFFDSLFTTKIKPKLSVIVIFYNMRREAKRTLFSLTREYQKNLEIEDYEVIAIDSGSSEPLNKEWVESLHNNFRYYYIETEVPSPCKALNFGINVSKSDTVVCCIDGARILSPNILSLMIKAQKLFLQPFVYTLGFHIGEKIQNEALLDGYSQIVEDALLKETDWEKDGYKLFSKSCLAGSSSKGYFHSISESNCFSIQKDTIQKIGGFDERFISSGGGLVNLDVFKRLHALSFVQPVMLLGEGTFHQFHGGVATNVPRENHPFQKYKEEYDSIRISDSNPFKYAQDNRFYLGSINKYSLPFVDKKCN